MIVELHSCIAVVREAQFASEVFNQMLKTFVDHVNTVWAFSLTYDLHMPAYNCCLELRPKESWKSADVESDSRSYPNRSSVTIAKNGATGRRSRVLADPGSGPTGEAS